ncbi:uncharacterized protein SPPG_03929 [Spizellomyces punctatus DAOM BR117]|uniref:Rhodanese domain-containing protein n=2 Tax=Spizellomyces punctatus (strain DAOM BR117) TaxID=645134 RepID=A0A0L0HJ14_SPIPD|nr:uncharacterized protein SPPG_03929 [Spizellomyces punctatus DAOM BR117]KND00824.1 hypothetical protein SPPG_03929 [Spizellomyces punctatus DAOM BR117]|eukprot:XP_016608863.1 hypothetical protein SPPG_03929 [Spizellomyces punctatus DAOM BR117]
MSVDALKAEIEALKKENEALKAAARRDEEPKVLSPNGTIFDLPSVREWTHKESLDNDEISRFSRQLLMREIGVQGQLKLRNTTVLVVGAGGLGAPAVMYLAAAGIGRLGIVDYDPVEASNLQRQIVHDETRVGMMKAESAKATVNRLSSFCDCIAYNTLIESSNAMDIIRPWDIVVDATDNVATRYLLNDACVLAGKPLVSGSALRMDGQLTVYNHAGGPCYRCIFPAPPPPETVTNCSDGGVLGVVPGIIGCLQALEVIKIASGLGTSFSQKMLLFDATSGAFRTIKLRGQSPTCAICGKNPTITDLIDYVQFCGAAPTDKTPAQTLLPDDERSTCREYSSVRMGAWPHLLLDVRETVQFNICSLPNSLNVPLKDLERRLTDVEQAARQAAALESSAIAIAKDALPIYVVCRRGNDSQVAVQLLRQHGFLQAKDIAGGLERWASEIDPDFPTY